MTVTSITFGEILKSAALDDIDAAVLLLQNIAGIDDGGIAGIMFSGFDWDKAGRGDRVRQICHWLSIEQRYEEDEQANDT